MKRIIVVSIVLLLCQPTLSIAQHGLQKKTFFHNEIPDDHSVYMPLEVKNTSSGFIYESSDIFTTQVNINDYRENILGDAANEPSIAIDPTNPDRIMIGWRQFENVESSFRQAGYAYSLDRGKTWLFPGCIDPGVFRSDPVLECDKNGVFHYNSLSCDGIDYQCKVFKTRGEMEWDNGTFAQGGDKQWMCIDNTDGFGEGHVYSNWTRDLSYCYPGFFTRSTDNCTSFDDCIPISGSPRWGTNCIGPNGELYVVGAGEHVDILVVKSKDAMVSGSSVNWIISTSVNLEGGLGGWKDVNPEGLLGQAWIDCDRSDGPGRGNVYVCASVDRHCSMDEGDVMFARSTDGGLSFEDPIRINTDLSTSNIQWFATMSVAPNGRIDIVWLDTRVNPFGLYESALFYSFSCDEGVSWSQNKQMSPVFDSHLGWPVQKKMGDYFDMVSDNNGVHLAWANTLNGEQDVYYSYIQPKDLSVGDISSREDMKVFNSWPNPFIRHATLCYKMDKPAHVKLTVFDVLGNQIEVLIDKYQSSGRHHTTFRGTNLPDGMYIALLSVDGVYYRSKMLKVTATL